MGTAETGIRKTGVVRSGNKNEKNHQKVLTKVSTLYIIMITVTNIKNKQWLINRKQRKRKINRRKII